MTICLFLIIDEKFVIIAKRFCSVTNIISCTKHEKMIINKVLTRVTDDVVKLKMNNYVIFVNCNVVFNFLRRKMFVRGHQ